jgi:hypothetical protein
MQRDSILESSIWKFAFGGDECESILMTNYKTEHGFERCPFDACTTQDDERDE